MKRIVAALIATSLVAATAVGSATEAQAHDHGFGIAAGIIGGIAVGSALASQRQYDDDAYYYRHHHHHRRYYVEEDVSCRNVRFVDDYGHRYWRQVCR